jgi:hypothetical protein
MLHEESTMKSRFLVLTAMLLAASAALADDIYIKSGTTELKVPNATIRSIKDGQIFYSTGARETNRDLSTILRIEATGEDKFNAAEKAFAAAMAMSDEKAAMPKFAEAVSGYQSAMSSSKQWLKDYATMRMQVAAPRSGRFDIALTAWLAMLPKDATGAMKNKPPFNMLEKDNNYLAAAIKSLKSAAGGTSKAEERRAILDLLADLQQYTGDEEGAMATQMQLADLGGDPALKAKIKVRIARGLLNKKNAAEAKKQLADVDPAVLPETDRTEYDFVTAELDGSAINAGTNADTLKDVAIKYMRVVAANPSSPEAGASLLKVAEIHELLKEPETALKIYKQVAREHANTPAGEAAGKSVERLGKSAASNN